VTNVRRLNQSGIDHFSAWVSQRQESGLAAASPPPELLSDDALSESIPGFTIDPDKHFESRYEFGVYLNERLVGVAFNDLMAESNDGMWAWLAAVYFTQLASNGVRRREHYIVQRRGAVGSLAYRHSVRTPFELTHIHSEGARICLGKGMGTWGELAENLTSRQSITHNRGFFRIAKDLYLANGVMKRGAASKPKKPRLRKPGDRTGFGSIRRLALALQRLDLTYDTEVIEPTVMRKLLPKEFGKFL